MSREITVSPPPKGNNMEPDVVTLIPPSHDPQLPQSLMGNAPQKAMHPSIVGMANGNQIESPPIYNAAIPREQWKTGKAISGQEKDDAQDDAAINDNMKLDEANAALMNAARYSYTGFENRNVIENAPYGPAAAHKVQRSKSDMLIESEHGQRMLNLFVDNAELNEMMTVIVHPDGSAAIMAKKRSVVINEMTSADDSELALTPLQAIRAYYQYQIMMSNGVHNVNGQDDEKQMALNLPDLSIDMENTGDIENIAMDVDGGGDENVASDAIDNDEAENLDKEVDMNGNNKGGDAANVGYNSRFVEKNKDTLFNDQMMNMDDIWDVNNIDNQNEDDIANAFL